ncbi:MAG: Coenzyme F420 hydrogenase/dehydrogenase, beta subunit C-terminal domain [Clostridia bacterium]|nr:Coenzyme F420 hydrogenase/dehydrogenase, beta subunit C-terminal domain [Clostridia bacterium]
MDNKPVNNITKISHDLCTGCGACYNKCPVDAITMQSDDEGFLAPRIKESMCTNCGACLKACPVEHPIALNAEPDCYAAWTDEETRLKSSSGGFFSILANYILDAGGVICGAAYANDYLEVKHVWIDRKEDLQALRGSKYLQSEIGETYRQAKQYLVEGRPLLYTGTPCQIAGLKNYLNRDYENLYLVDIMCHGATSPAVYKAYVTEKSRGSKITRMDFREKAHWGWGSAFSLFTENGTVYRENCYNDPYMKGFLSALTTRKSCDTCRYANIHRVSDFSLGDFWGVGDLAPDCDDRKGTSLILVNSEKARALSEKLQKDCALFRKFETPDVLEIAKTRNGSIRVPTKKNAKRDRFFSEFAKTGCTKFLEAYHNTMNDQEQTAKKYDVGYVGWWDSKNYGSALTSFAMNRTLKNMGKSVLMLEHDWVTDESLSNSYGLQFAKHFYECSKVTTAKNYARFNNVCDTFLVGSDQLWHWENNKHNPGFYFLNFAYKDHKKIAYATSFGSDWSTYPENIRLRIGYYMSRFDAISVREKSGVELCKREFDMEATHVMDPVFLCDMASYQEVIALSKYSEQKKEKYVFSYILDPTEDKINMVRDVAKKLRMPYRIAIDALKNNDDHSKKVISEMLDSDPNVLSALRIEDWLCQLANASFVATDSFHGFCYSIIFKKPMIGYVNERRGKARFDSITQLTGLQDRLVTSYAQALERRLSDKKINFAVVEDRLNKKIEESKKWLSDALNAKLRKPSVKELLLWKCLEHDDKINKMKVQELSNEVQSLQARLERLEQMLAARADD